MTMKKERLDAITDGIMAVISTLMLMDIKIPNLSLAHLPGILYQIFVYAMSFVTVVIVWLNHHRITLHKEKISINSVWINFGLLFVISFIPTATAHLSESFFDTSNHVFYGVVTTLVVLFYAIFQEFITRSENEKNIQFDRKMSWLTMGLYLLSIPLSLITVYISGLIFLFVPALYFIQSKK